ncbi:hypothetical protein EZS27_041484, partial [termite gut metagenome]
TFKGYRIIMVMDGASWHRGDKLKKWENIVPLFQPAYSPEVNPTRKPLASYQGKGKIQEYYSSHSKGSRKQAGRSNKQS